MNLWTTISLFFWPFSTAFILCLILTPIVAKIAQKYNLVDDPKKHKHPAILHKRVTPRAGGLAVFLAFLITSLIFLEPSKQLIGILAGGALLIAIGIADDKLDLAGSTKLPFQFLAALLVVGSGVGIAFITNPLSLIGLAGPGSEVIRLDTIRIVFDFFGKHSILLWADIFAVIWIIWVINMVNFSSGVDGQMPGIVLIALLVLFASTFRFGMENSSQTVVQQLALAGMGATLGFLIFNFYPAKIFPGDSAPYFLGFLVAVLAILSGAKVGTAFLVMAVPLVDSAFTIIRRVAVRRSPFAGDRGHLHHKLLELGWGQRRIALFYWLVCAILGAAALTLHSVEKLFAGVVVAVVVLGGLLWLNMTLPQKAQK